MRWIVSAGADIVVNTAQLEARRTFIAEVTTAAVSPWSPLQVPHAPTLRFLYCNSADGVDGTFITAHIYEVYELCALPQIAGGAFVVANTCIWERMAHKKILAQLLLQNRNPQVQQPGPQNAVGWSAVQSGLRPRLCRR